ncbi:YhcH/YjgK/YiaL family protein [Clostridium estertheticum]|uniref:YhcH/YjgK/YiaL family protein n=1 Tax=Clostridium estertheticum TaxID=238834 RepID=UPI001CF2D82D|nr:YhcH/YjgK/YiaL family protein [Clostridium estertheticum]MCB2356383.1 YhcH/YjgK/YiaL family protein [Clostridium estertheticum]WAG39669.1 YhcH/YjgK/YiaL family protein [Clostridium estertheticum]
MIFESIKNVKDYTSINTNFKVAFNFLKNTDLNSLKVGRYEVDGENVYVLVQEYTTQNADDRRFEAHVKYIDIQYVVSGKEIIGFMPTESLEIMEDKLQERDAAFYKNVSDYTKLQFKPGDYGIFFPEDAHKPCCAFLEPSHVKKIVVKVCIN